MLMKRTLFFGLGACLLVASSGCRTTFMNIRTLQPAAHSLHPVQELVLIKGKGHRSQQQVVASELIGQSSYFRIQDARGQGVRISGQGQDAQIVPAPAPDQAAAYVQINIEEWSAGVAVVARDVRIALQGGAPVPSGQIGPKVRGVARLAVRVLGPDGKTVLLRREFAGASEMPVTIPPPPAAQVAARAAIAQFLDLVTPTFAHSSVKLDRKDKDTLPFVELARADNIEGAADGLEQYVRQHPRSSAGHYNLAVMLDALGEYEAALNHYDKAIVLGGESWYRRGRISCAQRLAQQAR